MTITEGRLQLGWSLSELARRSGLTYQTVSSMEKGNPSRDYNVAKVAKALSDALDQDITVNNLEGVTLYR